MNTAPEIQEARALLEQMQQPGWRTRPVTYRLLCIAPRLLRALVARIERLEALTSQRPTTDRRGGPPIQ